MILNSFLDFSGKFFLELGSLRITWYAFCILTGIILACVLGFREAKKFGIAPSLILDGVLICVPLAIIGARLYYVFTSWSDFSTNSLGEKLSFGDVLLKIIGFTGGSFELAGLAINGGIIVALIFVIVYCIKRKINTMQVFDLLAPGLLIGQICGRWGNFFNQEAHGPAITEKTQWITKIIPDFIMNRMEFYDPSVINPETGTKGYSAVWHPTFLYESLWNLIGLVTILISRRKNKHQRIGDSICFYLIWYGLGRSIIIEPLRMDPLLFVQSVGPDVLFNRVNVVVNLLLAIGGIVWLTLKHLKFKEPFYIETQQKVKEEKIDGVICRIDETLVSVTKLLENTYYYTAKDQLDIDLDDNTLKELIKVDPKEYFKDEKTIEYFYKYFNEHLEQIQVVVDFKEFFKTIYKHDYHVAVVTKYDKEFALYVLEALKIKTYISIIVDKDLAENQMEKAFDSIKEAKNILVITALANDIKLANEKNAQSCFIYFGSEIDEAMDANPTHVINRAKQINNIVIE